MHLTPQDRLCIPVPLYHCFGMVLSVLACVAHGSTMVFPGEAFDPLDTLATVQEERCTALHGVPTMFIMELDHPEFSTFDLSSLRTGIMAGAPCPVEVMRRLIAEMHMKDILIGYGQTEVSPINNMTLPDDSLERRTETVGRAVPWVEIKVIDEANRVVPIGEKEEIVPAATRLCRAIGMILSERQRPLMPVAGCIRVIWRSWTRMVTCRLWAESKT